MHKIKLYEDVIKAKFISRPNRFIAHVLLPPFNLGNTSYVHVPSTGRMKELLVKGSDVYIVPATNKERKTKYTLVGVLKDAKPRLIDSRINNIFCHLFKNLPNFKNYRIVKFEHSIGKSRFDVLIKGNGKEGVVEIKSVTLLKDNIAAFPDAPSVRAVKHIRELIDLKKEGYDAFLVFLISGEATYFIPNFFNDKEFFKAFMEGYRCGLEIMAYSYFLTSELELLLKVKTAKIPFSRLEKVDTDKGSYIVLYKNKKDEVISVGGLGEIPFKKGYYIYTGSAKTSISARTKRHKINALNKRWHIDYIHPPAEWVDVIKLPFLDAECVIARLLSKKLLEVKGFGSSDCKCTSHLFYSPRDPREEGWFIDILHTVMFNMEHLGLC